MGHPSSASVFEKALAEHRTELARAYRAVALIFEMFEEPLQHRSREIIHTQEINWLLSPSTNEWQEQSGPRHRIRLAVFNALARKEHNHELEFKLLLSKTFKGWNIAENTVAAKNLTGGDPWEFGYAIGASRPLALKASVNRCSFCPETFIAGVEMYGALGDRHSLGLHETSHYLAPVLAWNLPSDWTFRLSPGLGLNDNSHRFLLRWGVSREFSSVGTTISRLLGGRKK